MSCWLVGMGTQHWGDAAQRGFMPPGLPPAPTSEHHEHGHNSRKSGKTPVLKVSKSWTPGSTGQHAAVDLDAGHWLHVAFLCCTLVPYKDLSSWAMRDLGAARDSSITLSRCPRSCPESFG